MCCFSGPVIKVDGTSIFARMVEPGRQLLVYELSLAADNAVAMVLPLPVTAGSGDDAVRFIDLQTAPEFFSRLEALFAPPPSRSMSNAAFSPDRAFLKVHAVGDFVASFVPSLADFSRLDARFRMPEGTLDRVPEYADWGFAVFQLANLTQSKKIHPMAFEFATRAPHRLFFPTLHVHDGALHDHADYAHYLYAQGAAGADSWPGQPYTWRGPTPGTVLREAAGEPPGLLAKVFPSLSSDHRKRQATAELLDQLIGEPATLRHRQIFGNYANQDTWVPLAS